MTAKLQELIRTLRQLFLFDRADLDFGLVTFFSRYYDEGDFIARRRYSGPGRERYMIPYDGEEVKLVWANMDQYYIKTDEYLRDYRFRVPHLPEDTPAPRPDHDDCPVVLFKLVDAAIEKDNRKTAGGDRRDGQGGVYDR